jgi:hypothetical protein
MFRRDTIQWLVLEFAPETGGWFLFGHAERGEPSEFDNWYEDEGPAREQALDDWGVTEEDWKDYPK